MSPTGHDSDLSSVPQRSGSKWLFRGVLAAFAIVLLLPFLSLAIYEWRVSQQRALLIEIKGGTGWLVSEARVDLDDEPWFVQLLGESWAMPRAEEFILTNSLSPDFRPKFDAICRLVHVESLALSAGSIDDADLSSIARLKSLKSLDLTATDITDAGMEALLGLSHLEDLDLSASEISDRSLKLILQFKALTYLRLQNTRVSQAAINTLRQARPGLEIDYLPVASLQQVTVVREIYKRGGFVVISESGPRASVTISGRGSVADWSTFDWSKLEAIPEVASLNFINVDGVDRILSELKSFEQLRTVRVERSPISARFVKVLGECAQLETVWLIGEELPEGWAQQLERLENLETLFLENARMGRSELAAIATLKKLNSLVLRKAVFEPGSLDALDLPPVLERLELFSCNLTDSDVKHLARCRRVKDLSLIGNREVTDQSIDVLLSMPALKNAAVDATGFTPEGEQQLEAALRERNDNR